MLSRNGAGRWVAGERDPRDTPTVRRQLREPAGPPGNGVGKIAQLPNASLA